MAGTSEGRFSRRTGWKLTPNRLTEALLEVRAAGREVLDLTVSNPTRAGIQYDADSILKSIADPAALDYDPQPKGLRCAREAVAEYYSCGADTPVREVDPESLVQTNSTSEGYSYIFRLLANPGDEVLVPQPSYPLFDFLAGLPQMKLGWTAVSGPEKEVSAAMQRLEVIADTYLSLNAPVQLAAATLLEQRKNIQPQLTHRVHANLAELDRQLSQQQVCARLAIEGGWYAVLRVPATQSDEDLAVAIVRDACVMVHPGHFYDFPTDGFLVLSLITQPQEFCEGVRRVLKFLGS